MSHEPPYHTALIGPDFIATLAETQLQSGLETTAAALRANAGAWQQDRDTIQRLRDQLHASDARFARIRDAVQAAIL